MGSSSVGLALNAESLPATSLFSSREWASALAPSRGVSESSARDEIEQRGSFAAWGLAPHDSNRSGVFQRSTFALPAETGWPDRASPRSGRARARALAPTARSPAGAGSASEAGRGPVRAREQRRLCGLASAEHSQYVPSTAPLGENVARPQSRSRSLCR